jgi:cell division protease FtsH
MSSENTPRPTPPKRFPFGRPVSPLWLGALLFGILIAANVASHLLQPGKTLTYSEFRSLLAQGEIVDVKLSAESIRGHYRDGQKQTQEFSALRIEDPKLVEELTAQKVKYEGEVRTQWLAEITGWLFLPALILVVWTLFFRRMGGAEGGIMSFARSRAKIYAENDVKVSFSDVAGADEAEEELREIVDFLKMPTKYTNLGGRIPKGVLLVGPPGTGKTLLARAVAGEAHVPYFSLSGSEFVEMFVGVGAARVRDLFRQAEAKAPCIVFIDELDALGKVRTQSPMGGHEEREQTLNQLLAEMDGFDARKGVIIMAATNRPEVLDPALLRPGRFDRRVLVDKPDVKGREAILRIHLRTVKLAESVDVGRLAARTSGFAGADLANLVNEAALLAARRDKAAVDQDDFHDAVDRIVAGLEKKRVMKDEMRRLIAIHEGGHAIVRTLLPNLDAVHKVSIIGRGFGALGYTMHLPSEDRYLQTKADLENELASLLGGRSAEWIVFGKLSTGAHNDLLRATDIARAMVTEYGMSDAIGPVNHDARSRGTFLDTQYVPERGVYAEDTARVIDAEIKHLVENAETRARDMLTANRTSLDALTELLLEKEVIEGDELRAVLLPAMIAAGVGPAQVEPADPAADQPTA